MNSIIAYLGGKSILSRKIVEKIPKHATYCEVFAGAAWVLFRKNPDISRSEVINDINGELTNLYRIIKHHFEEFVKAFKWVLVSRDEYARLKSTPAETLTDIQRAAKFYYVLRNSFGAKLENQSFGVNLMRRPVVNLLRIEEELSAAHLRLSRVWIENLHYEKLIVKYDRDSTFFYLDPPYWDCENDYGKGLFDKADFKKLSEILASLKGKFLLSINDAPEIREIFKGFTIEEAPTRYSVNAKQTKSVVELLIRNY